jgi:ATP-dependent protease ClpP protease subunit
VVEALAGMEGDITVRLNSAGGIATDGAAIYNALKRHDGAVTVTIDGLAASAASLIAMAGDTIVMPLGSLMMIHEPAGITLGTADEHRRTADTLETMGGVYAEVYADRSGRGEAEIRKMMKAETWLTPKQAVEKGFATTVDEAKDAATADATFDYGTYRNAPAHLVASARDRKASGLPMVAVASAPLDALEPKGTIMSRNAAPADPNQPANPTPASPQPEPAPVAALPGLGADAVTVKIYEMCGRAKMSFDETQKIIASAAGSLDKARDLVIDAFAAGDTGSPTRPVATVAADERDRFRQGVEKSLMSKAGLSGGEVNEFSAMSLREIARMSLEKAGIKLTTGDPMVMVGAALGMRPFMAAGMHSTSDFVEVLANVANKSMLKGYMEAEETFPLWTASGTLTDFKATKRVDLNLFPSLGEVPEGAEYTFGTIGDRGETVQLATYGKMFAITRQAIINDDLSVFTRVPSRMGRAARRTIGNLVYAILTGNPAMADGVALFHADHDNTTTGTLTTANLDAARAKMARQQDPDGHAAALNIRPAFLLVPTTLAGKARQLITSEFEVTAAGTNNTRAPNYVRDLVQVVDEARLDADSTAEWYLAANPNAHDTIEVSYLNGVSQPTLEQRDGWNVDGVEFKARIDAGVKALDFRGLVYSTGA